MHLFCLILLCIPFPHVARSALSYQTLKAHETTPNFSIAANPIYNNLAVEFEHIVKSLHSHLFGSSQAVRNFAVSLFNTKKPISSLGTSYLQKKYTPK